MATAQNIIRTLTIRSKTEGVQESISLWDRLRAALFGVEKQTAATTAVTDTAAKHQLSLADAVAKAERRFNSTLRAQQDFEKIQRQMNLAVAQNPALQARANAVLALAAQHFDQVSKGQRAFSTAMQAANDNLRGFAQSAGPVGAVLSAMGPGGIAAAVGIGAAVIALHQMITAATTLADRAGKLKDFAETTGFTVIELQALEKAGAQVGVSSESVTKALERFSVQMAEVKLATGETYEKLLAINPVLARQVSEATSLSKAYELVSRAIKGADLESGNQLARAFFGRSGVEQTRLMRAVADAGGLKGVIAELREVDIITKQQAERWDTLGDKIAENMKAAKQNIASIFTEPVLEAAERFSKAFLELSREMKQFEVSERLQKVMEFLSNPATQGAIAGALAGARGGIVGAGVGAIVGGGAGALFGHADAIQATEDVAKLRFELEQLERSKVIAAQRVVDAVNPADVQRYAAILERTNQRILEIQQQMPRELPRITVTGSAPAGPDGADRAAERAAAADRAYREGLIKTYNEMQRWMGAIAGALTLTEKYERETARLNAQWAQGVISSAQLARGLEDQKQRLELSLGVANMAVVTEDRLAQVREVAAKAGLTDEQTRLALSIATAEARERENQAWRRANPIMAQVHDISKEFAATAYQGLLNAKAGTDSLSKSFEALSLRLAEKSLEQFMSGEWEKAAVSAIMAVVAALISLVSHTQDLKGMIDKLDRLNQLRLRHLKATTDTETLQGQMAVFNANAILEIIEEQRKGGQLLGALLHVQQAERLVIERDFAKRQIEIDKQAADERIALAKAIADRQLSFQDRVFAAANDNSTLAGQLAAFDRAAQREIIAERDAGGQAMADLEAAQIAERLNVIKSFNDKILDETKRAEEARLTALNGAARTVVDYLQGLVSGPSATVSPIANLTNSQSLYNANLALAQGGNIDAQNKFPQLADNLEKAARAVYASAQGYQDIKNQIIAQGLALPAVVQTDDPVVIAIRDSITAIQATTAAVDVMKLALKTAMETTNPANVASAFLANFGRLAGEDDVIDFSEMQAALSGMASNSALHAMFTSLDTDNSGNLDKAELIRIQAASTAGYTSQALSRFDTAIARLGDTVNNLISVIDRINSSNTLLDAIISLQATANQTLGVLRDAFVANGPTGMPNPFDPTIRTPLAPSSNSDPVIIALRKIVFNTGIIANNTHGGLNKAQGVFASGGWVNGGIPGRDSVPIMAMPREFIVNADATRALTTQFGAGIMDTINAGRLPERTNVIPFQTPSRSFAGDDNSEIKALRQEVAELRKDLKEALGGNGSIAKMTAAGAVHVREGVDNVQRDTGEMKRRANMRL